MSLVAGESCSWKLPGGGGDLPEYQQREAEAGLRLPQLARQKLHYERKGTLIDSDIKLCTDVGL